MLLVRSAHPRFSPCVRCLNPRPSRVSLTTLPSHRVDRQRRSYIPSATSATDLPPSSTSVIFSGIQPTGVPHLGNYFGALQTWVDLQNQPRYADATRLYSLVDLHALTTHPDGRQLQIWRRECLAALLAVGLDPERSILFYQSQVRSVAATQPIWEEEEEEGATSG